MSADAKILLECPHCRGELYQPTGWFQRVRFSCPACGSDLMEGDFSETIAALAVEMDRFDAELINGEENGCCCAGQGGSSGSLKGGAVGRGIPDDLPGRHTCCR